MAVLKKYPKLFGLLLVGCLAGLTFLGYRLYQNHETAQYKKYRFYIGPKVIKDYAFVADGNGLVIDWEPENPEEDKKFKQAGAKGGIGSGYSVSKNYLVTYNVKLKNVYSVDTSKLEEGETYFYRVFDLRSKNLSSYRDIPVIEEMNRFDKRLTLTGIKDIYEINGQEYLAIGTYVGVDTTQRKILWLNLKTGKFEPLTKEVIDLRDGISFNMDYKPIQKAGIGYHYPTFYKEVSQLGDIAMKQEVPKAYKLLSQKDGVLYPLIRRVDNELTDPQAALSVLQLLLPPETNIFDYITIPSDMSIDGQEHKVHNLEDYLKYYKVSPSVVD